MHHKTDIRLMIGVLSFLAATAEVHAGSNFECEFVVHPKQWIIPENNSNGKLLLAWEVTNSGEKFSRFRIRDLGKITLISSDGKKISPVMLGVDTTKAFQNKDYPLLGPNETLYFPFVVTFSRQENNLFSLKLRSDPEGDEGWIFKDLNKGKYSVIAIYSVKKNDNQKSNFMWKEELQYLKPKFMDDFWEGEVLSKPVEIIIMK